VKENEREAMADGEQKMKESGAILILGLYMKELFFP
jgi:hypothetical protein